MPNTYSKMFTRGPESALPESATDGMIRLTTDTGRLFIDGQSERTEVSDFVKGMTEDEIKSQLAPLANKIYISSDTNKFLILNSESVVTDPWINIANSGMADHADSSDEATHATSADTATYATNASTASEANHAATATYANNAGTATYATNAGTAVHASTADYATNAGTSTYATNASTATYATNSGTATHASTADYATKAGTATYATNAGTSTYATNAGTSTYATNSGTAAYVTNGVRSIASGTTNGTLNVNVNGSTSNVSVKGLGDLAYKSSLSKSDVGLGSVANLDQSKAIKNITRTDNTFTATALDGSTFSFTQQDSNTTYAAGAGIALNSGTFSNSGVRSIATGGSNGTINVNTNGTTANVSVKGLGDLAYKSSLSKSDVGLGNVANYDQSKAIKSITRSGTTFTATAIDGTTSSFTQQDNNTTYTGSNGITLSGTNFTNSGVRSISEGTSAGTINVNTNGSTANVAVKDAGKGIKSITRSGTTFTCTAIDGTTSSFTQQDNNTTYSANNGVGLSGTTFYNTGVRAIATGGSNGTINVNTNGTTANVSVKGLGDLAYKSSLSKSDVGLANVANYDQSKAVKNITRNGTTFTATALDGSTFSFTQQDTNTWRGIQNNLTSDSTSDSLSAAQGKALANGSARDSTKILDSNRGKTVISVTRGASISTKTYGFWSAMCNSGQTGSPVLPTSGKWWHVLSMDWSDSSKDWVSQLAIATQDGSGVYYRKNDASGTDIDSSTWIQLAEKSDISTLQSNFQAGVDSVYNAIVARGTTPASKSLSDVVTAIGNIQTTHTGTYKPTSRASNCDMGQTHSYRYVNTTAVPNSNSGTYTPAGNAIYDMGATNDKRYCDGRTAFAAGKADHTTTYTPTARASNCDMGATHSYRYVNTNSVPNNNYGTYTYPERSWDIVADLGQEHTYRTIDAWPVYRWGVENGEWGSRLTYSGFKYEIKSSTAASVTVSFSGLTTGNTYLIISTCVPQTNNAGWSQQCALYNCTSQQTYLNTMGSSSGVYGSIIAAKVTASSSTIGVTHYFATGYTALAILYVMQIGG